MKNFEDKVIIALGILMGIVFIVSAVIIIGILRGL